MAKIRAKQVYTHYRFFVYQTNLLEKNLLEHKIVFYKLKVVFFR